MKGQDILNTKANISDYDDIYEALIKANANLSLEESVKINIKMILFLANHIGCKKIILEALEKARA